MSDIADLFLQALKEAEALEACGEPTDISVPNAAPGHGLKAFYLRAIREKDARETSGVAEPSPWGTFLRKHSLIKAMRRRDLGEPALPRDARIFEEVAKAPQLYGLDIAPRPDLTGQQLSDFFADREAFYAISPLPLPDWQPGPE